MPLLGMQGRQREQVADFTVVDESRHIDYVALSPSSTVLEMSSHCMIWTNGRPFRDRQDVAAAGHMLLQSSPFSGRLTL